MEFEEGGAQGEGRGIRGGAQGKALVVELEERR